MQHIKYIYNQKKILIRQCLLNIHTLKGDNCESYLLIGCKSRRIPSPNPLLVDRNPRIFFWFAADKINLGIGFSVAGIFFSNDQQRS